jgi:hypothetical protein
VSAPGRLRLPFRQQKREQLIGAWVDARLGGLAQGALGAVMGPASQALTQALGPAGGMIAQAAGGAIQRSFQRALQAAPEPDASAPPEQAAAMESSAQAATERGVLRALVSAQVLRNNLSDVGSWREVEEKHPEVARAALRRASAPQLREELRGMDVDDSPRGRAVMGAAGGAGRAGLDAGLGALLGAGS